MFAFLKGMGEYIGGTIAGKVIVVAVAAGTVATGTGVAIHNSVQQPQDKPKAAAMVMEVSSNMSSSNAIDSQGSSTAPVTNTSEAVSAINQAASAGVSQINDAASKAVSQVQAAASQTSTVSSYTVSQEPCGYAVISPNDDNIMVWPGQPHYDEYKAALGGDAGTVDPSKSTAIAAARAKIAAAKAAANKASSASSASSSTSSK